MRDRRWDWALGPSGAEARQAQEDMEIGDGLNTLISGYAAAESAPKRDWEACLGCDGHGCRECRGTGLSDLGLRRRRRREGK
jgi:hypothetical protein